MKYIHTILFVVIFWACTDAQTVVSVHDADTYKVLLNGKIQTVRLQNVDAPELNQYFGKAASDSVAAMIFRRTIYLETHGVDLYGRLIGTIKINGLSLDSLIISKGWAWSYSKYLHKPELNIYEAAARKKGLGMWKCEFNIPPWTWRKLSKRNKRLYEVCR